MPGAFAPRFAIEAGFLILLGVGAGYADLRPAVIIGVVAVGWVLVALIELAIWRSQARAAAGSPPVSTVPGDNEELELESGYEPEAGPELSLPPADDDHDDEYPLRAGAADTPSEEVEAYTRIVSGSSSDPPTPVERSD